MKPIVNFETAKRLKEAGFPQPEALTNFQFYYHADGSSINAYHWEHLDGQPFAPNALEMLAEMEGNFSLSFKNKEWVLTTEPGGMHVAFGRNKTNPAEMCAGIWLLGMRNENAARVLGKYANDNKETEEDKAMREIGEMSDEDFERRMIGLLRMFKGLRP